jgi:hypothetical protein
MTKNYGSWTMKNILKTLAMNLNLNFNDQSALENLQTKGE